MERLVDLVADEEIFNPPTAWLVDETAETLMPFLANGDGDDDDDQPELLPDLPEPGPKPDQPGLAERIGNVDLSGRPAEIHHADVVNVYQAPVTINNYGAAIDNYAAWVATHDLDLLEESMRHLGEAGLILDEANSKVRNFCD